MILRIKRFPTQGRVSHMANPSSMPIASNITAIPKATVPTGPSPNTIPRLLDEDLQDSNVDMGPNNVWYRPPKSFSISTLILRTKLRWLKPEPIKKLLPAMRRQIW